MILLLCLNAFFESFVVFTGALIVSEFMGCSRSLSGVLRVNPWRLVYLS